MKTLSLLLFSVWLAGCATTGRQFSGAPTSRLFPDGVYQHDVRLRTLEGKEYGFRGVVRLAPEKIAVVGLGPLGATVFQIVEQRPSGNVDVNIYQKNLEQQGPRLLAFFRALRSLLLLEKGGPPTYRVASPDGAIDVTLERADQHGIPARFTLKHEKFTVTVDVAGYTT